MTGKVLVNARVNTKEVNKRKKSVAQLFIDISVNAAPSR
jgi:hypothetical protein